MPEVTRDGPYVYSKHALDTGADPHYLGRQQWVSMEFKRSQLRVGTPWANCGADGAPPPAVITKTVSTIIPVYLGNPALHLNDYTTITETLQGAYDASNPVKIRVILPIFIPDNRGADGTPEWTEAGVSASMLAADAPAGSTAQTYQTCYSSGRACPLDHSVCEAEQCELDRWRQTIQNFKAAAGIEVLGMVETKESDGKTPRSVTDMETDIRKYLNKLTGQSAVDGFYFAH